MPPGANQKLRLFDPDQATLGMQRWRDRLDQDDIGASEGQTASGRALSAQDQAVLEGVFSVSPYLTECILAEPDYVFDVFEYGPDHAFHKVLSALKTLSHKDLTEPEVMRLLRIAKRRIALAIAMGDLAGLWSLDQVTGAISAFAQTALQVAIDQQLRTLAAKGLLSLKDESDPSAGSGYVVLAMGKLGAKELNYSSDIDLIVLFDPEKAASADEDGLRQGFIRMTKALIKIMQERTKDGYVFRTDLRLRPDPSVTPVAISVHAAESYYESLGLTWERAAMIKATPFAGDLDTGEAFLSHIRPFVWRKFLDFAAIEDIHGIKRRINAHRGHGEIALLGHDVKVGRGGIREIEFYAQTQQLIWGGRIWTLRTNRTLDALNRLATEGLISVQAEQDMREAYHFLRSVEHRIQMVNDAQTQCMPDTDEGVDRIAAMMGYDDPCLFREHLLSHLRAVEHHYVHLFEDNEETAPAGLAGLAAITAESTEKPEKADIQALEHLGFSDGAMVARTVTSWSQGQCRATRSQRAQGLLKEVTPQVLSALAETANPDQAFIKFDEFLRKLPAGVQLFSLFRSHPGLLNLVSDIMGSAPRLAQTLSKSPNLLDSVLDADFFQRIPTRAEMIADIEKTLDLSRSYEEMLDYVRRWRHDRLFQVGVLILRQRIEPEVVASALSDLADACIIALLPRVCAEFAGKHGIVPGAQFAVVGMGKLGSREMSPASDLDLVTVYTLPSDEAGSDGERPLGGNQYYARLTQRLINAISAPTAEGRLYEVDMRLRPSGNAGPIAANLATLEAYYNHEAWDWEHMALTRARVIAGDDGLGQALASLFHSALSQPRDPEKLLRNVASMRHRMAAEHKTNNPWDIKHWRGGLVDIEFLTQYLQLREAATKPEVLQLGTPSALKALGAAGVLSAEDQATLVEAQRLWHTLQSMLRLTVEDPKKLGQPETIPEGLKMVLGRTCSSVDFDGLETKIKTRSQQVAAIYDRMIQIPADDLEQTSKTNQGLNVSSLLERKTAPD